MNSAERRKLEAAANKLLKGSGKKSKAKEKYPGTNLPFKIFTQTQGTFISNHAPNCIEITKWEDINSRQNKGRYENLPNKTYYKINLKTPGIYFYQHMEIVLRKDFYYKPGNSGFFSLTIDGKIQPLTAEEARESFSN
ncbi:MAG: hypothetical protein RSE08_00590 [Lactococcus sp.]